MSTEHTYLLLPDVLPDYQKNSLSLNIKNIYGQWMRLLNKKPVGLPINCEYSEQILITSDQNLEAETEGVDEENNSMELTNLSS